ncbi:MAG: leucine-rich repeat protein [Clostridia bacterium]|nr:leucine-rich repeat protein [Clostridia bacterium]
MSYTLEERIKKIEESRSYEELIGKGILPKVHNENYYFVSYSHKDYKAVLKDILELQEKGINLWYDSGMRAGENWEEIAKQFISKFQCKGVIFYLSENSLTSSACSTEIKYVLNSDKKFFSINLPLGNGEITDGATMAQTLKNEGAPISPATVDLAQKAFSDKHLYLPYSATIENKKDALEKNLVGEDLFEFELAIDYFDYIVKLIACRDNSIISARIPETISREKIVNKQDLEKYESTDTFKVTKISGTVFANYYHLEEVVLPNTIGIIGDNCFRNCHNLKKINSDQLNNLEIIDDKAFLNCSSLLFFIIPNSVTYIGESAFDGCKSLSNIVIGKSVRQIKTNAFGDCKSLTSIEIPNSVTTVGDWAFYECNSLTKIKIGKAVETIGKCAFSYCESLPCIEIPNSVTTIDERAFGGCKSLMSVKIGEAVKTIGESAFAYCKSLSSIEIPNSVTTIGDFAFQECNSLTKVKIGEAVETIGKSAFSSCESLTSIVIPDSVTNIGKGAFECCNSLTTVKIGKAVEQIGMGAFVSCSNLQTIHNYTKLQLDRKKMGIGENVEIINYNL